MDTLGFMILLLVVFGKMLLVDCIRKVGKIPILPTFCKKVGKVEVGKVEVGYLPTFEKKSR